MGTTSAETSYYKLLNPTDIKVGDIIHFAVIVQDANKRKRVGGGDFWLATLSSDKNPNASTAGKIVDYDNGTYSIEIKGHGNLVPPIDLPYCGPNLEGLISDGFWFDGIWTSFKCKKPSLDVQYVGECFRNKEVHLLGDSTLRQWGKLVTSLMSGHDDADQFVKHHVKAYNFTLTLHFNKVKMGIVYRYDLNEYEVDVLDSLRNPECNYVIVFSAGFHYVQWSREAYKDHLLHLRAASMELLARCPDVPIVFKGLHPRDHPWDVYTDIAVSDYIIHEMLQLARNIFDQPGVQIYFLETWDLALSYPSPNKVHMPYHTEKEEEVSMFLSYACQMKETK
ncbi:NXPE family member 4-like [Amphiura filiformis]|uniref:NXPE family member 4-like n=1 Tax=Amphiura filiformis TaxID=82378 RepID=UPI003B21A16C